MPHQLSWSKSTIELLRQCPRQWFLKYGRMKHKHREEGEMSSTRASIHDMSIRVARRVLYEWLEDRRNGTIWTEGFQRQQIRDISEFILHSLKHSADQTSKNHFIQSTVATWMKSLLQHPWMRMILNNSVSWMFFPRTEAVKCGNNLLYAAPDIIVYQHGVWTCLRIQFSPIDVSNIHQLEVMTMGVWALHRPYMTEVPENLNIRTLSLKNHRWKAIQFECNRTLIDQAKTLVKCDTGAMSELRNQVLKVKSLDVLPLARHPRICKSCPHRDRCPASSGLKQASLEQKALELFALKRSEMGD